MCLVDVCEVGVVACDNFGGVSENGRAHVVVAVVAITRKHLATGFGAYPFVIDESGSHSVVQLIHVGIAFRGIHLVAECLYVLRVANADTRDFVASTNVLHKPHGFRTKFVVLNYDRAFCIVMEEIALDQNIARTRNDVDSVAVVVLRHRVEHRHVVVLVDGVPVLSVAFGIAIFHDEVVRPGGVRPVGVETIPLVVENSEIFHPHPISEMSVDTESILRFARKIVTISILSDVEDTDTNRVPGTNHASLREWWRFGMYFESGCVHPFTLNASVGGHMELCLNPVGTSIETKCTATHRVEFHQVLVNNRTIVENFGIVRKCDDVFAAISKIIFDWECIVSGVESC